MVRRVSAGDTVHVFEPGTTEGLRAQHFNLLINLDAHNAAHVGLAVGTRVFVLSGPQPPQEYHFYGVGEALHAPLDCVPCLAYLPEACTNPNPLACMQYFTGEVVLDAVIALL